MPAHFEVEASLALQLEEHRPSQTSCKEWGGRSAHMVSAEFDSNWLVVLVSSSSSVCTAGFVDVRLLVLGTGI